MKASFHFHLRALTVDGAEIRRTLPANSEYEAFEKLNEEHDNLQVDTIDCLWSAEID